MWQYGCGYSSCHHVDVSFEGSQKRAFPARPSIVGIKPCKDTSFVKRQPGTFTIWMPSVCDAKCLRSFSIRFIEGGNESYWWFPFQSLIINGDIHSIIFYIFFVIKPPSLSCLYPQHPASLFGIQLWRYGRNRSGGRKHQGATNR